MPLFTVAHHITMYVWIYIIFCKFEYETPLAQIKDIKMNIKPIAVGLLFGVGMALALKSWLLGIMFGVIFYVSLNEAGNKKLTK